MSDPQKVIKFHALTAAFMLPVGVMFLVTGALYMWGIKGSYVTEKSELTLTAPLAPDADALKAMVTAELEKQGLSLPSGGAKVKKGGTSFWFEWTGAARDVTLSPTADPLKAQLQIKETTMHRQFVQLHKGKGGVVFKVFSAIWAVALLGLFLSGMRLAFRLPSLKTPAIIALVLGFASFAACVFLS